MLSEFMVKVKALRSEIDKVAELLKVPEMKDRMAYLETKFNHSTWKDIPEDELREYSRLKKKYDLYFGIWDMYDDLHELTKLALEEGESEGYVVEFEMDYNYLVEEIQKLKLELMFNGKYDSCNAILNIHSGAGGKEAQDWARMLLQMYAAWANKHDFGFEILDWQDGEDGSVVKSVSVEIRGENVYGLLSAENGVHRLVRVSPFDSQNRRHTSFAAVEVMPEIEADNSVELDMKDVRVDTFRSSGKGGQHVNKTESAIRLTHIPTGIVVGCQQERSQHQNKEKAMKMLISRLVAIKEKEHYDNLSEIQGEQSRIEWGNQIRSYVFMPYQMVKDHRTNHQTSNIDAVMRGDIDEFIFKSLAE
jgi:peptide chain release factor 2